MPEITLPEVNLPEFHRSDVKLPDFSWSGLKRLDLKPPDVHLPEFALPKVDLPNLELPDLASLKRLGRPAPRRSPIWPWAIVAASAAIFAGWWLWTSSLTGPRVRQLADRARERIAELRNARSHQEGADQEAAATGWASEPSWQQSPEVEPIGELSAAGA